MTKHFFLNMVFIAALGLSACKGEKAMNYNELTPEEAIRLAPQLSQNPSRKAALIRAKAAGGKEQDYGKIAAAYLGPESWRFPQHHDQRNVLLWALLKACGSPGGNQKRTEAGQMMNELPARIGSVDVKKDAPATERIAMFRKLWADYRTGQPKLPSVHERLAKILYFIPLFMVISFWLVLVDEVIIIPFILLGFFDSIFYVVLGDYINRIVPSEIRATALSFGGMMFSLVMVIIFPLIGLIGENNGLRTGYLILAVIVSLFYLFLLKVLSGNHLDKI